MDTDDFTEMTYDLIVRASLVSDTLKSELGAMSMDFGDEDNWLRSVREHCREILANSDAYVDFWNLEEKEGVSGAKINELADLLYRQADIVLATPLMDRGPKFSGN